MTTYDLTLTCRECYSDFSFTESEQRAATHDGFTNRPTRCPDCRTGRPRPRSTIVPTARTSNSPASHTAGGSPPQALAQRRRGRGRRTYSAVCAQCGVKAELPFQPRNDRPVYCLDCFTAHRRTAERDEAHARTVSTEEPLEVANAGAPEPSTVFKDLRLDAPTRAAVASMGISTPTPIQQETIPILQAGRDVIGQARTGSGKTLAFAIPLVEGADPSVSGVQAMVLVPTRELAIQVAKVIDALAARRRLKVTLLYGGRSLEPEHRALNGGAQVVVGTPGRTLDHLRRGNLSLHRLRMFVLDEADEMLDRGFAPDVESILSRTPKDRQTALFSATMPAWVTETAARHLRDPETVQVDAGVHAPPEIEHLFYDIDRREKLSALRTLLDRRGEGPVLVFGRTKHGVKKLAQQLSGFGYPAEALQGNLSQNAREHVMKGFRSGKIQILVATNVAARGLDVQGIEQVINYDLPDSDLLFTHRVGRTGRMGRQGEAITFITAEEAPKWREIRRALGRRFSSQPWPEAEYPVMSSSVEEDLPRARQNGSKKSWHFAPTGSRRR